jgi:hypothetical protein
MYNTAFEQDVRNRVDALRLTLCELQSQQCQAPSCELAGALEETRRSLREAEKVIGL